MPTPPHPLEIEYTTQFRKDLKLVVKRHYEVSKLITILNTIAAREPLDPKHLDHDLQGKYKGFRECHIGNDWLLIYRIDEGNLILTAVRTGTHSDLF
jgi:mRNA interferase YafQ